MICFFYGNILSQILLSVLIHLIMPVYSSLDVIIKRHKVITYTRTRTYNTRKKERVLNLLPQFSTQSKGKNLNKQPPQFLIIA